MKGVGIAPLSIPLALEGNWMSTPADDDLEPDDSFWNQLGEDSVDEPADWAGDELEAAYLRAMETLEATEAQFPTPEVPSTVDPDEIEAQLTATVDTETPGQSESSTNSTPAESERLNPEALAAELTDLSEAAARRNALVNSPSANVTPRQILEALLFVGGEPFTTRKLSNVLRGEFSAEYIETQIDELNSLYFRQGRPYEIRLGEGGYRMTLREEFERIRRKTYGLGPKEVKLTQEAIEVLALVAYHQPVTAAAVEEMGKPGCGSVLRQLLRRELISVERTPERPREVAYRTTVRFLSLFGIRSLNDLPRLEQVAYK
jgi:segregation and condensation protein B